MEGQYAFNCVMFFTLAIILAGIVQFQNTMTTDSSVVKKLKAKIRQNSDLLKVMQTKVDTLSEENRRLLADVDSSKQKIQMLLEAQEEGRVAFSAYTTSNREYSWQTIIFGGTDLNVGNHYNNRSGEFTCPVSGIYFFTVTLFKSKTCNYAYGFLYHDSNMKFGVRTGMHTGQSQQSTNTGLFECFVGEKVWVTGRGDIDGDHYRESTFSGFLVYPDFITKKAKATP